MKKFLAIDTSSSSLTVIARGEKTVITHLDDCAMKHSVKLLECVEKTLSDAGMGLSDFDFFACVTGAGSFTGIRIGIATVKGFCDGEDKPALGVTSFDCAAYTTGEKSTLALVSAGHNYYYACGYAADKEVIFPPAYLSEEQVGELAGKYELLASAEALPFENAVKTDPAQGLLRAVSEKCGKEKLSDGDGLRAVYVRRSQAEENRK